MRCARLNSRKLSHLSDDFSYPQLREDSMSTALPDTIALFLYQCVIVPWETQLKTESGCWDVKRSREALKATDILLQCVNIGEVELVSQKLRSAGSKNFIVFVSRTSQMKDLFNHLRNCAAHAGISSHKFRINEPMLRFSGTLLRRPELAVSGQIESANLSQIVAALVTTPVPRMKSNPAVQT